MQNSFVDHNMIMRYYWGLGIGHTYAHNHLYLVTWVLHQHPIEEIEENYKLSLQIILQKCCLAKILEMNWNFPLIILKMILLNFMLLRKIIILLSVIMVMSAPSIMRKCM